MTEIVPPSPGVVIRNQILRRLKLRQADLARAMDVSTVTVNHIVNGKTPITAGMAVRLGRVTGTSPDYWLGLQRDLDLFRAKRRLRAVLDRLPILDHRVTKDQRLS